MRLSEAIRLGAMLKPQGYTALVSSNGRRTCAIGAALDACGHLHVQKSSELPFQWREHMAFRSPCPDCGSDGFVYWPDEEVNLGQALTTISHLNDEHHWTREQIADWVESVERATEPAPVETPKEQFIR